MTPPPDQPPGSRAPSSRERPSGATKASSENICVYCGSSPGADPAFMWAGTCLGKALVAADLGLVYGGATIGVMGAVADAVLDAGGEVVGVIPSFLFKAEIPNNDVTELIVTDSMHERKQIMYDRSCAFVALPGGIGTLEELVEMMTWAQLGQHGHPVIIANINGFWDPLLALLDHMLANEFIHPSLKEVYHVADSVEDIIEIVTRVTLPPASSDPETFNKG